MRKSGLVVGVVVFVLAIAGSFVSSLVCAPCWGLFAGLGAGYLAGAFDKPLNTRASAKSGAQAGAIGAVGGLIGLVIGTLLNAAILGPEYSARFLKQLGITPPPYNPVSFYSGALAVACCLGLLVLPLMAGLGAVGGRLWYQIAGKNTAAGAMPPTAGV